MINKSIVCIMAMCFIIGCQSIAIALDAPGCLKNFIRSSKPQPKEISSYLYNGKTVYLVVSDCCDFYNSLYDADCNYLCAPSGGITGKGDGKCSDFADKATNQKVIWKADQ